MSRKRYEEQTQVIIQVINKQLLHHEKHFFFDPPQYTRHRLPMLAELAEKLEVSSTAVLFNLTPKFRFVSGKSKICKVILVG